MVPKDHVLLDITHLSPETIMKRLPGIIRDLDPVRRRRPDQEPIPVVPTCHYQMGGIPTNYKGQGSSRRTATRMFRSWLLRRGECACASVHGANRLGTNSLLDLLVFGKSAGETVADFQSGQLTPPLPDDAAESPWPVSPASKPRPTVSKSTTSASTCSARCRSTRRRVPFCRHAEGRRHQDPRGRRSAPSTPRSRTSPRSGTPPAPKPSSSTT